MKLFKTREQKEAECKELIIMSLTQGIKSIQRVRAEFVMASMNVDVHIKAGREEDVERVQEFAVALNTMAQVWHEPQMWAQLGETVTGIIKCANQIIDTVGKTPFCHDPNIQQLYSKLLIDINELEARIARR